MAHQQVEPEIDGKRDNKNKAKGEKTDVTYH
jgi:hypothetical protein